MHELDGEYRTRVGGFVDPEVEHRFEVQRLAPAKRMGAYLLLSLGIIPILGLPVDLVLLYGDHLERALVARFVMVSVFFCGFYLVRRATTLSRAGALYTLVVSLGLAVYGLIAEAFDAATGRSDHEIVLAVMSALLVGAHPQPAHRSWPLLVAFAATAVLLDVALGRLVGEMLRNVVTVAALGGFGLVASTAIHAQARTIFAYNERLARAEAQRRRDQEADADAARHAFERRDAEWRSIVDNAPVLVILVDASDTIVFANHAAHEIGLFASQAFSERVRETGAGEGVQTLRRIFDEGVPVGFEAVLVHEGRERTFSFHAAPVGTASPVREATVVGIDVTQAKTLTHELVAAQKQQTLGALAGGVAHDFNNLLMVIMSAGELLLSEADLGGELRERVQDILDASSRAANLTRQLLLMSRRNPSRGTVIDLNAFLTKMKKLLDRVIGVEMTLELQLDGRIPNVHADPSHLEQIVMNLVVNARDAMPEGGIIRVSTRRLEGGVENEVEDHGSGMDAATQAMIFEPFFTTKAPSQGTGLGLATVKSVVAHLQGKVGVDSVVGRGTRFRVWLPGIAASERPEVSKPALRGRPLTVLVVDDDLSVGRLCCAMLEHAGHRVIAASDVATALAAIEAHPEIEVLLTDVRLPLSAGPQIAAAARRKNPRLGVVFMSGFVQDHELLDRVEAGSEILLDKPFTSPALLDALTRSLARAERAEMIRAQRRSGPVVGIAGKAM